MGQPTGQKAFYLRDADGRGLGQVYRALRLVPCSRCERTVEVGQYFWLFRSLSFACVHAAFSPTPCESALSSRASQSTKRQ
jgi:hypothetical protein